MNIKVINKQGIDGQTDIVEENADGSYYRKNGKTFILYKVKGESCINSVMITVTDENVTVKRSGEADSIMVFDRMRKTRTRYRTFYGEIELEIHTEKTVNALTENGGKLRLVYTMLMQGQKIYNDMEITVE